jgi:putative ABC transport system permease protein
MIKQILKIVWSQRRSNLLIWMELMLVFVLLWMVMDQIYGTIKKYRISKGFDIENTYYVDVKMIPGRERVGNPTADSLSRAYEEPFYTLLEKIKRNENVEYASASIFSRPYNGGNSWSSISAGKSKSDSYLRIVDNNFFKVFRIPITYGKELSTGRDDEIVLSKRLADSLFKSGSAAIGRQCRLNDVNYSVVGVTESYKYYDFSKETSTSYQPFAPAFKYQLGWVNTPEICIRLKPTAPKDAIEKLRKELSTLGDSPYYIQEITSFETLKQTFLGWTGEKKNMKMSAAIIVFFLVNILLGIVGTFWFRTEQRRNEIGLRMAIGSSSKSLLFFFLKESMLLLGLAVIPGILLTLQLRVFELHVFSNWDKSWMIFALAGVTAYAILAAMILLGTWFPARQASKVQPSEALHYE